MARPPFRTTNGLAATCAVLNAQDNCPLMDDVSRSLVIINSTKPFNQVEIEKAAVLGELSDLNLHAMCVGPSP